jgi:hypothetical protein
MGRRPTLSNSRPSSSGPSRFPNANGMMYAGTTSSLTSKKVLSTSAWVKNTAL